MLPWRLGEGQGGFVELRTLLFDGTGEGGPLGKGKWSVLWGGGGSLPSLALERGVQGG